MAPNNNNKNIKKTMSPQKKNWLSRMTPVALGIIDQMDEIIKALNPCDLGDNKNTLKYVGAIKAFYICTCNADIVGCRWWFGKFKDRSLKKLERIQESKKDCVMIKIDTDGSVTSIEGQDNVYMNEAEQIKNIYSGMEQILTCLEKD
jgi:hypothetical protein